ncbi:MAG: MerR family transcriptional regulator [Desulfohalobiaceae bacterium]
MLTANEKELLKIGEVAARAGVTVRTVRYYLERGLIREADRSPGGFYLFTPDAAETVFYIQKLKEAGLALRDIEAVYRARHQGPTGDRAASEVERHLRREKEVLEQRVRDYQRLKAEVEEALELVAQCRGCEMRPSRETCLSCGVFAARERLPLPIQAIL